MLLFYTPGKHEKRFYDVFSGYGKATPGCNGLNWMYISHMNLWFVFSLDFLSIKFLCFHILARNCGDDNKKKRDRNKQMFKTVWQLSKLRPFTWALRSVHNSNELGHNVCVRVCVCVCLRPFTLKVSSVWISWNAREQINDVMLKPFFSYAKSLPPFFRMKHQTFLTMHHILFTH